MEGDVVAADLLREQDHVLILGTEDDAVPVEVAEVRGTGEGRYRAVPRDGYIGEVEPAFERRNPRVLDAKLFPLRVRSKRDPRDFPHGPAVAATNHTQMRDEREAD